MTGPTAAGGVGVDTVRQIRALMSAPPKKPEWRRIAEMVKLRKTDRIEIWINSCRRASLIDVNERAMGKKINQTLSDTSRVRRSLQELYVRKARLVKIESPSTMPRTCVSLIFGLTS